jgi:hypothetical protein
VRSGPSSPAWRTPPRRRRTRRSRPCPGPRARRPPGRAR